MIRVGPPRTFLRTGLVVALGLSLLLVASPLAPAQAAPHVAPAAAAAAVDLGSAAGYSVLAGAGVSNTGAATVLALDLGLSPAGVIAGFPPGVVTGAVHDKDSAAATAQEDRQAAYDAVVAQPGGTPFAGDQAGVTFTPGLYTSAAAITNTGTIVLDANGDPGALFVFQIGAAMSPAAASKVVLTDGALAHNVYWQVAGAVALGAGAKWFGTFLAAGAVSFGEGASLKGRILGSSTVALANSPITKPIDDLTAPVVSIDGGATRSTNDPTPMVTGTTDEPAGRTVRVAVAGQSLTTPVGPGGDWAVSATTLTAGPHGVLATITDPSGNTGTASQVLIVDVAAPVVTVTGGSSNSTNDTTPTISGTTDEPGAPTVTVTVAGQTLTATAVGGAWSVDATVLTESAHPVAASVDDAAGNTGSAHQVLDVDVTIPVVTIDGGATRSTVDTSPWTYGTTAEKAGTTVHLAIGGQSWSATVLPGGTWGVSATTLPEGSYVVVASVTDAAHNTGTTSQVLTIGPGGDPDPRYRPDAEIRRARGSFIGKGS
jgi:Ice-binding-like/Bacterial Ig-like domain